ncbi:MAG: cupin domain-containing protein [Acidiphilium sp.]
MENPGPHIVNIDTAPELSDAEEEPWAARWGAPYKVLTSGMERRGHLGINVTRLPPGRVSCPFHTHQLDDEAFLVLSGRGVLRYGETLTAVGPGDCVTCPAGTGIAHQFANPFDADFVYLGIGRNDPNEVCTYPDSGKVFVRALDRVGRFEATEYMEGEAAEPHILALAREII